VSGLLHQFRRAPGRILASVLALALAVGAIGVLAVPTVAGGTLDSAAARAGLADVMVSTSPLDADQIARVARLDGVAAAEGQAVFAVETAGVATDLIGLDVDDQTMDVLELTNGRMPAGDEIVTSPGVGRIESSRGPAKCRPRSAPPIIRMGVLVFCFTSLDPSPDSSFSS